MPSIRHTDQGPAARACPRCRTTHRAKTIYADPIACPPPNRWLIGGGLVPGLRDPSKKRGQP